MRRSAQQFESYEQKFLSLAGQALGALKHFEKDGQKELQVEILRGEALQSSLSTAISKKKKAYYDAFTSAQSGSKNAQ